MARVKVNAALIGVAGSVFLFAFFWFVTSTISGSTTAQAQLARFAPWILANTVGFGIQLGLFAYLRMRQQHMGAGAIAASGSTSAAGMVACCAHRLVDLLPWFGLAAFATTVALWQLPLLLLGVASNVIGIIYALRKVKIFTSMDCCQEKQTEKQTEEHDQHHVADTHVVPPSNNVFRSLRPLEWVGLVAVVAVLLNLFFRIDLRVERRPFLTNIGTRAASPSVATTAAPTPADDQADAVLAAAVLPAQGVDLPIQWADLGKKMMTAGVIDEQKFRSIYAERGGFPADMEPLLSGSVNTPVRMDAKNAPVFLNLLWAFGLGNKNVILEKGPMSDPANGGAGNFASTGGWPLSKGDAMSHYSKHEFVKLTPGQQELVERVSKGIYRPCCGNSVYFPDCNHGMAMLGLLELMAANNVSEQDMYKTALVVNSFWFPDTYLTAAKYFRSKGIEWSSVDPKEALGNTVSSASGFRQIRAQVTPPKGQQSGGGCGA